MQQEERSGPVQDREEGKYWWMDGCAEGESFIAARHGGRDYREARSKE